MIDLDPRTNTEDRIEPIGDIIPINVGRNESQTTSIAQGIDPETEKNLCALLWHNRDLFA